MDGLDMVAVEFDTDKPPQLLHSHTEAYPEDLRQALISMAVDTNARISDMCELDTRLGQFYGTAIKQFVQQIDMSPQQFIAIGSHGQTIRHAPQGKHPYTLQIGDPNIIAVETGITVVADFRRRDIALGGQGAPLAPGFHAQVFRSGHLNRAIINIGGIANVTLLPASTSQLVQGFDTGPGNTLLDHVCRQQFDCDYDNRGLTARTGTIHASLLEQILQKEAYFSLPAPKSTGTDYFSPQWLAQTGLLSLSATDLLATLTELTAISIAQGIRDLPLGIEQGVVCGGGAHNDFLLERLSSQLPEIEITTTSQFGYNPDWVEAMAFAWLAKQTLDLRPGNLPSVTNAQNFTILGGVYFSHGQG